MRFDSRLMVRDGGLILWRHHAAAMRYAEVRAALWGHRQQVRRKAGLWHVRKAATRGAQRG